MNNKRRLLSTLLVLTSTLMLGSCFHDYDEFYFVGNVIGSDLCQATSPMYLIEIEKPEGIGDTITVYGELHHNVVMGYRTPKLIRNDQKVYGVAYFTKDFAPYNCYMDFSLDLPEVILVSVDEDSATVVNALYNNQ